MGEYKSMIFVILLLLFVLGICCIPSIVYLMYEGEQCEETGSVWDFVST